MTGWAGAKNVSVRAETRWSGDWNARLYMTTNDGAAFSNTIRELVERTPNKRGLTPAARRTIGRRVTIMRHMQRHGLGAIAHG